MRVNDRVSIAVFDGEPMVLFWRAEDMGLPLTTTAAVGEELGFHPDLFGPDSAEAAGIAAEIIALVRPRPRRSRH